MDKTVDFTGKQLELDGISHWPFKKCLVSQQKFNQLRNDTESISLSQSEIMRVESTCYRELHQQTKRQQKTLSLPNSVRGNQTIIFLLSPCVFPRQKKKKIENSHI